MRITTQSQIAIMPKLAELLSNLEVGDTVKGKIIEMLGQSISIKTASGQTFTAALMKAVDLMPGQNVELIINSITAESIFAELKTDNQKTPISDDSKLQQLLQQMDIKPVESSLQAAKLLVKYNMPVTKENVNTLVNTQKSIEILAQGDTPKAIALLQSELNINNTEITKLVKMAAVLEPQSQQMLKALQIKAESVTNEVKPTIQNEIKQNEIKQTEIKQTEIKQTETTLEVPKQQAEVQKPIETSPKAVMQQLAAEIEAEISKPEAVKQNLIKQEGQKFEKLIDTIIKAFETVSQAKPEQAAYMLSKDIKITPATVKAIVDNTKGENKLSKQLEGILKLVEILEKNQVDVKEIKQELKKLFLKPELLQSKEKVAENFKDIVKLGAKLEMLIKEQGMDRKVDISVLQDVKGNIDFIKNINANINYLQIPIQVNEKNTTAEIYVFNDKKRSKSVNPENATILVALDLDRLGHIESLITVNKKNVNITFKVQEESFKKVISKASETLKQSLEARGYSLNPLKIIDMKEKFNLLELEERISMDNMQLHVDIKV
ncbi:MAG TPA: flagellar hook-length control protein FliK [Methanosarcinales archaeon]|nr:flagellar hook-length control protein FliK [Methanosarcinales archaeon]